ncbi:unannotated protein [freshwater metagenome]|uniref:Unannotated protein n=1 Tax=freshwater metagenome TaxID=449393 RepID=A0A6J7RRE2_9ZZZZ|nr:trehalose-phosphatase [Actinomycetota bacterium]MSX12359.1 trehalose-phosphatase [Actinomycetota bacterium]
MPPASSLASAIAPLTADRSRTALLLDVDGTLAPIVRDPQASSVPELTRRLLIDCQVNYGLVGCVSGRQAKEARRIVGIGSLPYSGNHGLELLPRGAPQPIVNAEAEAWTERVRAAAHETIPELREASGLRIEDKGPIVALHWRGLDDEAEAEAVAEQIAEHAKAQGLLIQRGRSVIELRAPVTSTKSDAVRALLDGVDVDNALYVGDDRTDLDAFRALRALQHEGRLIETVCIGVRSEQTPSELLAEADLLIDGPEGVNSLLSALAG